MSDQNQFPGAGSEDERMRTLLNDAVSDVEPRDSLDSIRSRTTVTPFRSKRPWILGAGAAVVATAATVAAVAVMGDNPGTTTARDPAGSPTVASSEDVPDKGSDMSSPTPSTSADDETRGADPTPSGTSTDSSAAPTVENVALPVYYVGDSSRGSRLYREFVKAPVTDGDAVGAAVQWAMATAPRDPDYRTHWPSDVKASVTREGGVITIDLSGSEVGLHDRPAGMSDDEAAMSIEQVIYTAQAAAQQRDPVQFLLNGKHSDMVLGEPTAEPLAQGADTEVLAQVWIIEPGQGAEVKSGFKVTGLAAAFEANVQWELLQGDTVVKQGHTTAEECCAMKPYSFTVDAPPGSYTLVVHDSDPSGGEGFAPWRDTKDITIVP